MPGVGVAPGLNGFFSVSGSGIPGVGVAPFGILFAAFGSGIPGVLLPDGAIGVVERPSGNLLTSTLTFPDPAATFAFAFVFDSAEPHPEIKSDKHKAKRQIKTFDINSRPLQFKIAVPA
jgi:hypothetical protein